MMDKSFDLFHIVVTAFAFLVIGVILGAGCSQGAMRKSALAAGVGEYRHVERGLGADSGVEFFWKKGG